MSISATVQSQPISAAVFETTTSVAASASGSRVSTSSVLTQAAVLSPQLIATASGGIGPAGAAGPVGEAGPAASIASASDAMLDAPADGDVLRYSSNRWRNYPEVQLTDGGAY